MFEVFPLHPFTLHSLLFFAGGVFGSFLCVCVERIPAGLSVLTPRSRCPICENPIAMRVNIPVIGFFLCGGKCLRCRGRIPVFYPAVELLCAASAAAVFGIFGFSFEAFRCFIFLYFLIAASVFDLRTMTVPDFVTFPFAVAGVLASIPAGLLAEAAAGAALGGAALFTPAFAYKAVRGKEGMGMGDVKLMTGVGAFVGAGGALLTILSASIIGTIGGFVCLKLRGEKLSETFPFAPFIAVSAVWFFFAG